MLQDIFMSLNQEKVMKYGWTCLSSTRETFSEHDSKKLTPKDSQFDWAINLARPCPFTCLVGLISMSYSSKVAIQLGLLPPDSACVMISLIAVEGTKTME